MKTFFIPALVVAPLIAAAPGSEVDGDLLAAVYRDDLRGATSLAVNPAAVNNANKYGVTPLSAACQNGNPDMVALLLKAGANPSIALPGGETPLMTASRTGKLAVLKFLIAHGADVNAKDADHAQTALMWAAAEGNAEAISALIAAGADLSAVSKGGFTAYLFAAREGKVAAVTEFLKAGVPVDGALQAPHRQAGETAMVLAASNAHFDLASMLVEAGANPNAAGQGWTALHALTAIRQPGYASNDPAPDGSGRMGTLDFVRFMAAHGADLNARVTKRWNIGLTSLNVVGATAFLLAARTGDAELMRLLAHLGADPLIATADGTTPLLAAAGVGTRSPGEDAGTEAEVLEAVKVALELGNDVNAVDKNGETAIHGVALKWVPSAAQYLLDHGAKIAVWNTKDFNGWTPLRIADGVHRGMNLRASPEVAAILRKALAAAGLSTEVEPEPVVSGATK